MLRCLCFIKLSFVAVVKSKWVIIGSWDNIGTFYLAFMYIYEDDNNEVVVRLLLAVKRIFCNPTVYEQENVT